MGFSTCQDSSPRSRIKSKGWIVSQKCSLQPDVKIPDSAHDIKVQTNMNHPGIASTFCVQYVRPKCGQASDVRIQAPGKKPLRLTSC